MRGAILAVLVLAGCGGEPVWRDPADPAAVALSKENQQIAQLQAQIADLQTRVSRLEAVVFGTAP